MMKRNFYILLLVAVLEGHRQKRYFYNNPTSPITFGFILNIPINIVLPTLINDGRALQNVNNLNLTGDQPQDFSDDPNYAEQLTKLTNYFAFLEIPSLSCQTKLICEFALNPDEYEPVSTMILKDLRQKHGSVERSPQSLMWQYMSAARIGYASVPGDCDLAYPKCPEVAHKLLNVGALRVYQYLSHKLGVKLV